jgi:hypothetical protein
VPRVVHHVQDLASDGQILQQCSTIRPRAARHRRISNRITKHRNGFRIRRDGPEALSIGRVLRRRVPVHRRLTPMHLEKRVWEARSEVIQIGEVNLGQRRHRSHRIAPEVYLAASG